MMADITTQRIGTLATVEAEPFTAAYLTWLQGKPDNMRRSYRRAISDLFDTIDKDSPANILQLDLARWKEAMKARALSGSTIGL